jgi:molybdate transport system substrate-binding protein
VHVGLRLSLAACLVLGACSGGALGAGYRVREEVTIFAAASLRDALTRAAAAYEAAKPGVSISLSFGASSALRIQIEQGAPAGVLLSADTANPERLVSAGLVDGNVVPFAANALAIVVPGDNPAGIASPLDLGGDGVTILAAADEVPITGYAKQLVTRLAALPGYPRDFGIRYERNVVSREEYVTAVLAKIELGEADAGIVYATDALASGRVEEVPIPPEAAVTARYAGVVIRDSPGAAAGRAFLDWLAARDGQAVLAEFGFGRP